MPDNTIQVGAVIDLSQIVPGFEQMSNSAKTATSSMNASFASVAAGSVALDSAVDKTQKLNYSTLEARSTIRGLGEQVGVQVPRYVEAFLSRLSGVGPALQAAFSVIGLIGFVEILATLTDKFSTWIGETYIYTAADKAMFSQLVATNNAIAERNKEIDKLQESYKVIGLSGLGKSSVEFDELSKKAKQLNQDIYDTTNQMERIQLGYDPGTQAQVVALANKIGDLKSQLDETNQKAANVAKTFAVEWGQGTAATLLAHAELVKKTADDEIATRQKQFEAEAQAGIINGEQEKILLWSLSEEKLKADKNYVAARRAVLIAEQMATGKDIRADQEKLNADLETAQKEHQARLSSLDAIALKTYAQQLESRKAMTAAMYEPGGCGS